MEGEVLTPDFHWLEFFTLTNLMPQAGRETHPYSPGEVKAIEAQVKRLEEAGFSLYYRRGVAGKLLGKQRGNHAEEEKTRVTSEITLCGRDSPQLIKYCERDCEEIRS